MKDLAKAVVKRQRKAERVANGGNQTRTFVERQCEEVNKLVNAVVKVDPDTLPDDIDIEGVLEAYRCVAREVGFQILIKDYQSREAQASLPKRENKMKKKKSLYRRGYDKKQYCPL